MSIRQNENYQKEGAFSSLKNFRYVPRSYSGPMPEGFYGGQKNPDSETLKKYGMIKYGKSLTERGGIEPGTNFRKLEGDLGKPIEIPGDYGDFMEPATFDKLSWGTPEEPVIRNMTVDGLTGQYVQDSKDKDLLVKTIRGKNLTRDEAIRSGRSGQMWQIDHIMPLTLGGADTDANRQLLPAGANDIKTRAQAVAFTLYGHGDITLNEARSLAMQWQNRNMTDIPQPDKKTGYLSDVDGRSGIQLAREAKARWDNPKVGFKEVLAEMPDTMKNLGEGWVPDPVREFTKGALSGLSFGFLPYELDDDVSKGSKTAGTIGKIVGTIGSFRFGSALIGGGVKLALRGYKGVASLAAAKAGYKTVKTLEAFNKTQGAYKAATKSIKGLESLKKSKLFPNLSKISAESATKSTAQKMIEKMGTLNQFGLKGKAVKLLRTEKFVNAANRGVKIGVDSAFVGQMHRYIQNHATAAIIGGEEFHKKQENIIKNLMGDFAFGAVTGLPSATLKGVAWSAGIGLGTGLIYGESDDPVDALTDAAVFASMHYMGSRKNPRFNNVKMLGGKETKVVKNKVDPAVENVVNHSAAKSLQFYNPEMKFKPGEGTAYAKRVSPEDVQKYVNNAERSVWKRFFFGTDLTPGVITKAKKSINEWTKRMDKLMKSEEKPKGKSSLLPEFMKKKTAREKKIIEEFGPGHKERTSIKDTGLPETMFPDLQSALAEIKRIRAAGRQLYKGGLSKEMRQLADIDDLLSFSVKDVNRRYEEQRAFMNPSRVKKLVENFDDSFFTETFLDKKLNPNTKYIEGDSVLTGGGVNKMNIRKTTRFIDRVNSGEYSSNIVLVQSPQFAPLRRMYNEALPERNRLAKNGKDYGVDPHPEYNLMAFGAKKNAKGEIEIVPIPGAVSSEHRLNKGKQAINKNLTKNQNPIQHSKDPISKIMKENGINMLPVSLDSRMAAKTVRGEKPFVPFQMRDTHWEKAIQAQKKLTQQGVKTPVVNDFADFNNAKTVSESSIATSNIKKNFTKPASDYIPKPDMGKTGMSPKVAVPVESARVTLKTMESSLSFDSAKEIKTAFKKNFGSDLNDSQVNYFLKNKGKIDVEEGLKILNKLAEKKNMDALSMLKLVETNKYINSGYASYHGIGDALLKLPIIGNGAKFRNSIMSAKSNNSELINRIVASQEAFMKSLPVEKKAPVASETSASVKPTVDTIVTPKTASRGEGIPSEGSLASEWSRKDVRSEDGRGRGRETTEGEVSKKPVKDMNKNELKRLEKEALANSAEDFYMMAKSKIDSFMPQKGSVYKNKNKLNISEIISKAKDKARRIKDGEYVPTWEELNKNMPKIKKSKKEIAAENRADYETKETIEGLIKAVGVLKPSGVTSKQSKQIKVIVKPRLINDIIARVSEGSQIPIKEVERIANKIVKNSNKNRNKKEKITLSKEASKNLFFGKQTATGKSPYDRLVIERKTAGEDFINWIKSGRNRKGLSESEKAAGIEKVELGSYEDAFKHSLDTLLASQFGKRYANAGEIKEMLGRIMSGSGAPGRKVKGLSESGNPKKENQPYEWTKDYLEEVAMGDKRGRESVIKKEEKMRKANEETAESKLTDAEISKAGLEINEDGIASGGFGIENTFLPDKIKNMTKGDQRFTPGLTSLLMSNLKKVGSEYKGSRAMEKGKEDARNVMQFIVGSHNTAVENGKKALPGKETRMNQKISLMPERGYTGKYENLSKEMKDSISKKTIRYFDNILKKYKNKLEVEKNNIVPIEKNITKLEKDIKRKEDRLQVDQAERSNWETDEFLITGIEEGKKEITGAKNAIKNIKKKYNIENEIKSTKKRLKVDEKKRKEWESDKKLESNLDRQKENLAKVMGTLKTLTKYMKTSAAKKAKPKLVKKVESPQESLSNKKEEIGLSILDEKRPKETKKSKLIDKQKIPIQKKIDKLDIDIDRMVEQLGFQHENGLNYKEYKRSLSELNKKRAKLKKLEEDIDKASAGKKIETNKEESIKSIISSYNKLLSTMEKNKPVIKNTLNNRINLMREKGDYRKWEEIAEGNRSKISKITKDFYDNILKKYKSKFETGETRVLPTGKSVKELELDIKEIKKKLNIGEKERPNWETDELLTDNLNIINKEVSRLKKL